MIYILEDTDNVLLLLDSESQIEICRIKLAFNTNIAKVTQVIGYQATKLTALTWSCI